jgi:hypothetical protein
MERVRRETVSLRASKRAGKLGPQAAHPKPSVMLNQPQITQALRKRGKRLCIPHSEKTIVNFLCLLLHFSLGKT